MRPAKRILLIDSDEDRLSVTRFLLRTNGYAVTSTRSPDAARQLDLGGYMDAVVGFWPLNATAMNNVARKLIARTVLVAEAATELPRDAFADCILLKPAYTPAELLERLKFATARKRGPQKQEVTENVALTA